MNKIIRRTIIVTITETWTIGWHDDAEHWDSKQDADCAPRVQVLQNTWVFRKTSLVEGQTGTEPDNPVLKLLV